MTQGKKVLIKTKQVKILHQLVHHQVHQMSQKILQQQQIRQQTVAVHKMVTLLDLPPPVLTI